MSAISLTRQSPSHRRDIDAVAKGILSFLCENKYFTCNIKEQIFKVRLARLLRIVLIYTMDYQIIHTYKSDRDLTMARDVRICHRVFVNVRLYV